MVNVHIYLDFDLQIDNIHNSQRNNNMNVGT